LTTKTHKKKKKKLRKLIYYIHMYTCIYIYIFC